ncbi:mechanosensitive ion channel family protein [Alkalispirochaeta alkalica]|uniref:mechanosensitive ion channel family protein n=1 Tax=Alkalispirochaeta alkalica TaxID=46356 RepID=UPI0003770D1A|nr:mechanosensitive ion channel family protein [Alkalispirochaeta alkalica]
MRVLSSFFRNLSVGTTADWEKIVLGFLFFLAGIIVLRIVSQILLRSFAKGLREQTREVLRKVFLYTGTAILFVSVLNATGVSVSGLLGAAGVLGIAVGIASQTSLSNIISGFFLVSERYFEIGDVLKVGEQMGTVYSVDLLSIKIRTFDNVLLRIPNQHLLEQTITNVTRFPVRRLDFIITIPIAQSIENSLDALRASARQCSLALEEPEPITMVREQTIHGWSLLLGVWFERPHTVLVRNSVTTAIQHVFRTRGLHIQTATIMVATETDAGPPPYGG